MVPHDPVCITNHLIVRFVFTLTKNYNMYEDLTLAKGASQDRDSNLGSHDCEPNPLPLSYPDASLHCSSFRAYVLMSLFPASLDEKLLIHLRCHNYPSPFRNCVGMFHVEISVMH